MSQGLPQIVIVGLPETAVKENKDRVKAAIVNSGFQPHLGALPSISPRQTYQNRAGAMISRLHWLYLPRLNRLNLA